MTSTQKQPSCKKMVLGSNVKYRQGCEIQASSQELDVVIG